MGTAPLLQCTSSPELCSARGHGASQALLVNGKGQCMFVAICRKPHGHLAGDEGKNL